MLPIQLVLISKFAFGPEKLSGLSRNGPQLARLLGPVSSRIHIRNFSTGTSCGAKFEKQSRHCETQKLQLSPYHSFGNATLKAVSCTAVKWDAYDAENTAGNARRCHSGHHNSSHFHHGNRAEVFIWQIFQPTYRDPGLKKCHLLRFPEEILCSN